MSRNKPQHGTSGHLATHGDPSIPDRAKRQRNHVRLQPHAVGFGAAKEGGTMSWSALARPLNGEIVHIRAIASRGSPAG